MRSCSADADSATRAASVTFIAALGAKAVFGDVHVKGTEAVDSAFVATLVPIRPGDDFEVDALYRAQRALYASELFQVATVGIDTSRFVVGDTVVPVVIEVTEGPTHRARGSGGYATNDCFRIALRVSVVSTRRSRSCATSSATHALKNWQNDTWFACVLP